MKEKNRMKKFVSLDKRSKKAQKESRKVKMKILNFIITKTMRNF